MTRKPALSRGKTKARMCAACPPQPCARITAGASSPPQRQVAIWRPRCSINEARASMRSSAAAAPPVRGGVRNRRSAQAPASSGKSHAEAAKRTFVLILGRRRLVLMGAVLTLFAGSEQPLERFERARARLRIAEQPAMVMHDERDAEELEDQLFGIGI